MKFTDLYDKHSPLGDVDLVAQAIATELGLNHGQYEALFPLIRFQCGILHRHVVAGVEKRAFSTVQRQGVPVVTSAKAALLDETFPLPDGTRVKWGVATVAQHQARIDYLQGHVDGINNTIERHRSVIREIQAAGVRCMAQLPSAA